MMQYSYDQGSVLLSSSIFILLLIRYRSNSLKEGEELSIEGNEKAENEIKKKFKLMERHSKDATAKQRTWSPGDIPPKNFRTKSWLQTDLAAPIRDPEYSMEEEKFSLKLTNENGSQVKLSLKDIEGLGVEKFENVDWHCVTGWSFTGMTLYGVSFEKLLSAFPENSDWTWVYQKCADGYTCPVFREDLQNTCFLALRDGEGKIISKEHGGPRLVFPNLWGWKSAKYVNEIQLLKQYKKGFWEKLHCNERGRIYDSSGNYLEERWSLLASKSGFHDVATFSVNLLHKIFGPKVYAYAMYLGGGVIGVLLRLRQLFGTESFM